MRRPAVALALMITAGLLSVAERADAAPSPSCPLPTFGAGASYHPRIQPSNFGPNVTNPYFPLPPGRTSIYAGTRDGARAVEVFTPSTSTRVIEGVRTRVVRDLLFLDGLLRETTSDYYAQDRCGNVWYFGEDTATLDVHGNVESRDGSFLAGQGGAQPGVYMQARPQLGRTFRQEWLPGQAEDVFSVIARHDHARVPYGTFAALRTKETTALEPGVVDNKLYVRGLGEVQEAAVRGGNESLSLVEIVR